MGAHRGEGRRDWLQQDAVEQTPIQTMNPWNIMIKHRQVYRRGRRSQMTMSYTDPVISMDLLRTVLQPSFNEDIMGVFRKYMKFFEKAASNVKENFEEDVQTEQLIREACRNCLENAKQLFSDGEKSALARPGPEPQVKRVKLEDESSQRSSPVPKKRKGRMTAPVGSTFKPTMYSNVPKPKTSESVKREGPKWDPSRLNEGSTFVLIQAVDLEYAADAQDKHWLAERQHMRATGGKMAYLLIEEDVQDLSLSNDYKDCPDLKMTPVELKPFTVPGWMIEKMQKAMEVQSSGKE
uniref:deoxynucleotidyltransferase terminal-interacting protein 1 n=1 Tax=Oncorhynchus gorbuscha TaxID=8017 RepID=UPI001EAEF30F|nr:deoxynucleotidyltransferase terminal-interacting protein 1 [Oncorhynchus gorbuscha]